MDGGSFDRLTRLFAGRLTRRVGLAGALGALAAGIPAAALELEARQRRRQDRPPRAEDRDAEVIDEKRPCGPRPKDNRCRTHKQCCTKYCKPPRGKQKTGRCRCIKPGKKCKNGQKCCGSATCQNRTCTIQPVGPVCAAAGGACTADANCCSGLVCGGGACGPCVTTVCASGCTFTSVNDAFAAAADGATIYIGPGSYPTGILVDKDITLAACPGVTGVELVVDRKVKGVDSYYAILAEDSADANTYDVTLKNLALKGTLPTNTDDGLLSVDGNGRVNFTLEDCRASDAQYIVYATKGGTHRITRLSATNFGNAVHFSGAPSITLAVEDSQFTGGLDSYTAIYGFQALQGTVTVTGSTFSDGGGGVYASMTQSGSLTVTNVTVRNGGKADSVAFDGIKDPATRATTTATLTNVTVDGCSYGPAFLGGVVSVNQSAFTNNGDTYGYLELDQTTVTLTDTTISGNKSNYYEVGGGIYAVSQVGFPLNVTFAGTTSVTGNSVTGKGGGIAVAKYGPVTFTNVSLTNVKNNTSTVGSDQCVATTTSSPNINDWSGVPNCDFNV